MLLKFDGTFDAPTCEFGTTPLTTVVLPAAVILFYPLWLPLFG